MPRIFAACCALIVVLMATANYRGYYLLSTVFTDAQKANKTANHYHK